MNRLHYPSKIGLELVIPITCIVGGVLALMIYENIWPGAMVLLCIIGFIVHMFATTFYEIQGSELIIRSGFLVNQVLRIDDIVSIKKTRNPLSAPALSLDRLEIIDKHMNYCIISPKYTQEFIATVQSINSNITYIS